MTVLLLPAPPSFPLLPVAAMSQDVSPLDPMASWVRSYLLPRVWSVPESRHWTPLASTCREEPLLHWTRVSLCRFPRGRDALCPESQLRLCAIPLQKEKSCHSWGLGSSLPPSQLPHDWLHNQVHIEELLSDARGTHHLVAGSSICMQSGSFQLNHCPCSACLRVT